MPRPAPAAGVLAVNIWWQQMFTFIIFRTTTGNDSQPSLPCMHRGTRDYAEGDTFFMRISLLLLNDASTRSACATTARLLGRICIDHTHKKTAELYKGNTAGPRPGQAVYRGLGHPSTDANTQQTLLKDI